jgi:phosphoserine phosphatase RsbU/P
VGEAPVGPIGPVQQSALLGGLGEEVLARLLESADRVEVPAGAILIRQGENGDKAYLILRGMLEVVLETALGEVSMARLAPQQIVGEIAVFTDLQRTATVRALEDSTLLAFSRSALVAIIVEHPEVAFNAIGALGRRINAMSVPLALLTLAAQALERPGIDLSSFNAMLESASDKSPFALSFQRIVREMNEKSAHRHEMEFAARLQQSILPRELDFGPESPYRAAAFMRSARDVGGDFYDYLRTSDGRAILVVADVSGKGIPASLFMAVSRTMLRALSQSSACIENAVSSANAQLEAGNEEGLFVTVFAIELHLATGRLRYVNAGHCDAYVLRSGGTIDMLGTTGPALAMIPGREFTATELAFEPGDLLFVASDGVTEAFAFDDTMFGEERLVRLLRDLHRPSIRDVLNAVDAAVSAFSAGREQSDDITCLALSRS